MNELLRELVSHLRGMWHRRWIGLGVAWLAAIIGVAIVYRIPERYEASARVYVDTESLLKPLLAGLAVQPNLDQQVALMSRTLISRPNVDKLVRMADLDLRTKAQSERDELIDDVLRTLKLTGNVQANLYEITYRDPDPSQARRVVQSLLSIFVESSLGDKKQDTQAAVKFLDDQVKRYEDQLQASEARLKEFRLKYLGVADKDGSDYFTRMSQVRKDIEAARLDVQSAEQARDAYRKELSGEAPTLLSDGLDQPIVNASVPELDARLDTLRKALDELRRKYTDLHPDVNATRRLIEQLEEERNERLEARRKAQPKGKEGGGPDRNPVFQQLKISLAEAEASLASAKARLAGYERQFNALKAQAAMVPQIDAEYTQLNRDYDVQKRTYESLLARRESATMGKDVQDTGGAQFRVIDPPRVSPEPVAPRRIMMLAAALALAVLAGLAASFIWSQVAPIFHETRSLRDVSKRPILGTISLLASERVHRLRRRNAWLFAGGLAGLFASFGAVFAFALLIGRTA